MMHTDVGQQVEGIILIQRDKFSMTKDDKRLIYNDDDIGGLGRTE